MGHITVYLSYSLKSKLKQNIFTGKATVTCAPNKMTVVLEKASMPGIDENYLKLRDSTCSLTSNGTHITGTMSFSTCGTRLEVWKTFTLLSKSDCFLTICYSGIEDEKNTLAVKHIEKKLTRRKQNCSFSSQPLTSFLHLYLS